MSFLLWHRDRSIGIASPRLVLRAAEVPLFADANALCDRLEQLRDEKTRYVAQAGEEARAQGLALGREQGLRQGREELAATALSLAQAAAQERSRLRGQVAALALEVARKLVGQLPDDQALVALAQTAARDILPASTMTLYVHPDRCEAVRDRLAALSAAGDGEAAAARFEVRGDPSCARETCLIETEHGAVDASLEAQLSRLAVAWGVSEPREP